LPRIILSADGNQLTLELPGVWLENHPLTRIDLEQERDYLRQIDIKLQVSKSADREVAA
jgi:exopolyphosphatase/guanosine-5'-triphosphate,3'-diphosphate pyrophosphatase